MHHQVRYLLRVARSDDPEQRGSALKGLASVDRHYPADHGAVRAALVAGMRDRQAGVRLAALRALRRLADGATLPAVAEVAAADEDAQVRRTALQLLAGLGEPRRALTAAARLIRAESDDDVRHRGLLGVKDRVDRDPAVRDHAIELGWTWLEDRYRAQHLGLDLLRLLDVPGEDGRCLRLLEHPDLQVRWTALWLLRRYPEHDDVSLRHLDDESVHLRRQATQTLAARGRADALQRLLDLAGDEDEWIRGYAAYGLIRIGGDRVTDFLRQALHSPHANLRAAAADGLVRRARLDDLDRAVELLRDEDSAVRWQAVWLVEDIVHRFDLEPLPASSPVMSAYAHLLTEPSSAVAWNVTSHLRIHPRMFRDAGAADPELVATLTAALDRNDLSDLAHVENSMVVVRLLGVLGDRSALPSILRWLDHPRIRGLSYLDVEYVLARLSATASS